MQLTFGAQQNLRLKRLKSHTTTGAHADARASTEATCASDALQQALGDSDIIIVRSRMRHARREGYQSRLQLDAGHCYPAGSFLVDARRVHVLA